MIKYLAGVVFIFIMTCIAWVLLGASVYFRTYEKIGVLEGRVADMWGGAHFQPSLEAFAAGVNEQKMLPLESSSVTADISLTHRQKGLLWYPTYKVSFSARYIIKNRTGTAQNIGLRAKFPNGSAIYDTFVFTVGGLDYAGPINLQTGITWDNIVLQPDAELPVEFAYNSQGLREWHYTFPADLSSIKNFNLRINTDFRDIDFPENTLSPSAKTETANGWNLEWDYKNLISGLQIGLELPQKLNPGPLAAKTAFYAPVGLFFFLAVFFIITLAREIRLHPMNYFFICAAFFAFHLLFAYLIDHISINASFAVSAVVSLALVVNYLHLFTNWRTAILFGGIPQLVFIVFFSYSFFFIGFTGLTITIVAIITLAFLMQITGKIDWAGRLKHRIDSDAAKLQEIKSV